MLRRLLRSGLRLQRRRLAAVAWGVLVIGVMWGVATPAWAADGAELFGQHCAGCHIHGGNIIRRGKTLRLAALQRNGIDGPAQIAQIAAAGVGQMSGYAAVLGDGGPEAVAAYVLQQAGQDWPRG